MDRVLTRLEEIGLLMEADRVLPSITQLVTGQPLGGAWREHPRAAEIRRVNLALGHHPDALETKIVSGRITWVHRRLWPALVTVATSREPWQSWGMSVPARTLLARVKVQGVVWVRNKSALALERRLLVVSSREYTESARQGRTLETWKHWVERVGVETGDMKVGEARRALEAALAQLNGERGNGALPWMD